MRDFTKEEELEFLKKITGKYECRVIVSDEPPYTLYRASDIGKIVDINNVRSHLLNYPDSMTRTLIAETKGGNQSCTFLTLQGLYRFLLKSRKNKAVILSKELGFEIERIKFVCTETDCIDCIMKAFSGEEMVEQFPVYIFKIDLYFPKYNLAIECDENAHKYRKKADIEREYIISEILDCCTFIRFRPDEKDFNIFNIINEIYSLIKLHNSALTGVKL